MTLSLINYFKIFYHKQPCSPAICIFETCMSMAYWHIELSQLYLTGLWFSVSQLSNKVLTVPCKHAIWKLFSQKTVCILYNLLNGTWLIFLIQNAVDTIIIITDYYIKFFFLHCGSLVWYWHLTAGPASACSAVEKEMESKSNHET